LLNIIAGSLSVGVTPSTNSYESIATSTVGSGGSAYVEFTSIPSTYTHLQVRYLSKAPSTAQLWAQFNSDTATNYSRHLLYGDGTSPANAQGAANSDYLYLGYNGWTNEWCTGVFDVLEYKNTNIYKTIRNLFGTDNNGSGGVVLSSSNWRNTNAVTSIKFYPSAGTFSQYTHFALYGIKGV
jgi:hypothetical protein